MAKRELVAVIEDTRLTPEACRVVMYVALQGAGEHEIPHAQWFALLNHPGEKRVRAALNIAQSFGWLRRRPGGHGHHDYYEFTPAKTAGLSGGAAEDTPAAAAALSGDTPAESAALSGLTPAAAADLKVTPAKTAGLSGPHTRETRPEPLEAGGGDGAGDEPPVVPLSLHADAERVLAERAGELRGCRKALRDYLRERVPAAKQAGVVGSVLSWADGFGVAWRRPDGSMPDRPERLGLIAAALNEIRAQDETLMKAPSGDIRNLKTKLEILVRPKHGNGTGGHHGRAGGEGRSEAIGNRRAASSHRSGWVSE